MYLRAGRFALRRERIELPARARAWGGLRLVQLSDFHAGPFLEGSDLADVFDAVRALEPDLLALTGDFLTDLPEQALELAGAWPKDLARLGSFAVFGNHDYRQRREEEIARAFAVRGVRVLRDEGVRFEREGSGLCLVGLNDLEEGRMVDLRRARECVRAGDVEIVLCHHPRGALDLARSDCLLVLSGHTHATQINLPWLSQLGPVHPGGRVRLGATTLVVHAGLGVIGAPLRIGARPELVVVDLT